MKLLNFNVVVFWNRIKKDQYSCIQEINNIFGNVFDMTPIINSIPEIEKLPPHIPVVVMNSSSGCYSISISAKQAGLTISSNNFEEADVEKILSSRKKDIRKFINYFSKIENLNRIGVVANCFKNKSNSTKQIMEKYSNKIIPNCEEYSIRFNQKYEVGKLIVNNIYSISNAQIEYSGKSETGILITRDINNKPLDNQMCQNEMDELIDFTFSELTTKKIKELI